MKTKTKNKIAATILIICALAIVASAILIKHYRGKSTPVGDASITQVPATASTSAGASSTASATTSAAVANPLTYKNTDYGFQVTFPDSMKGYTVEKEENANQTGVIAKYAVLLPTSDANFKNKLDSKAIAMEFVIFDPTFWAKPDRTGVHSSEIVKNDKYVYTYSTWEESPADFKAITDKDFIKVIGTFKLASS